MHTTTNMLRIKCVLVAGVLLITGVGTSAISSAQELRSSKRLHVKAVELLAYTKDLRTLAKATATEPSESEIASLLSDIGGSCFDQLQPASDLFFMYETMSSQAERSAVKPVINDRLGYSAELIEKHIETVNLLLGNTKRPGVAETGIRLREAMRDAVALLRSVRLK